MKTQTQVYNLNMSIKRYEDLFIEIEPEKKIILLEDVLISLGYTEPIKNLIFQMGNPLLPGAETILQNRIHLNSDSLMGFIEETKGKLQHPETGYIFNGTLILTYSNPAVLTKVIPTFRKHLPEKGYIKISSPNLDGEIIIEKAKLQLV